jgi:hypothetical protein
MVNRLGLPLVGTERLHTPDLRTARAKKLVQAAHPTHVVRGFQRRSAKYGSWRNFVTDDFVAALSLTDTRFNRVVKTLAAFRKITQ